MELEQRRYNPIVCEDRTRDLEKRSSLLFTYDHTWSRKVKSGPDLQTFPRDVHEGHGQTEGCGNTGHSVVSGFDKCSVPEHVPSPLPFQCLD